MPPYVTPISSPTGLIRRSAHNKTPRTPWTPLDWMVDCKDSTSDVALAVSTAFDAVQSDAAADARARDIAMLSIEAPTYASVVKRESTTTSSTDRKPSRRPRLKLTWKHPEAEAAAAAAADYNSACNTTVGQRDASNNHANPPFTGLPSFRDLVSFNGLAPSGGLPHIVTGYAPVHGSAYAPVIGQTYGPNSYSAFASFNGLLHAHVNGAIRSSLNVPSNPQGLAYSYGNVRSHASTNAPLYHHVNGLMVPPHNGYASAGDSNAPINNSSHATSGGLPYDPIHDSSYHNGAVPAYVPASPPPMYHHSSALPRSGYYDSPYDSHADSPSSKSLRPITVTSSIIATPTACPSGIKRCADQTFDNYDDNVHHEVPVHALRSNRLQDAIYTGIPPRRLRSSRRRPVLSVKSSANVSPRPSNGTKSLMHTSIPDGFIPTTPRPAAVEVDSLPPTPGTMNAAQLLMGLGVPQDDHTAAINLVNMSSGIASRTRNAAKRQRLASQAIEHGAEAAMFEAIPDQDSDNESVQRLSLSQPVMKRSERMLNPKNSEHAQLIAGASRAGPEYYDSDADEIPGDIKGIKKSHLFRNVSWGAYATSTTNDDEFTTHPEFTQFVPGRFELLADGTVADQKRKLVIKLKDPTGNKKVFQNPPPRDWTNQEALTALNKRTVQQIRRCTNVRFREPVEAYLPVERRWILANLKDGKPIKGWKAFVAAFNKEFDGRVVEGSLAARQARTHSSLTKEVERFGKDWYAKGRVPVLAKKEKNGKNE